MKTFDKTLNQSCSVQDGRMLPPELRQALAEACAAYLAGDHGLDSDSAEARPRKHRNQVTTVRHFGKYRLQPRHKLAALEVALQ